MKVIINERARERVIRERRYESDRRGRGAMITRDQGDQADQRGLMIEAIIRDRRVIRSDRVIERAGGVIGGGDHGEEISRIGARSLRTKKPISHGGGGGEEECDGEGNPGWRHQVAGPRPILFGHKKLLDMKNGSG